MNGLIKIGLAVFAGIMVLSMFSTCQSKRGDVSADVIAKEYSKGLDLQAVTNLARTSETPKELEDKLNSASTGVNNIDLNDDKIVDYINVTEFGEGDTRGFSLSTEIAPGKVQEIATITLEKRDDQVAVQSTGNPSLYGSNRQYHSSFGISDVLLWSYILSNHSSYRSPFGYGNYPSSYGSGWSRRSESAYASGNSRYRTMSPAMGSTSKPIKSTIQSPNASKQAARARIVSNPTTSQRSFTQRTSSKPRSSGGFGRSTSSYSSRSSFGGGK